MPTTKMPLTLNRNETLYGLQEYANTQREKEDTVEEGTEKSGPLPAK